MVKDGYLKTLVIAFGLILLASCVKAESYDIYKNVDIEQVENGVITVCYSVQGETVCEHFYQEIWTLNTDLEPKEGMQAILITCSYGYECPASKVLETIPALLPIK